MRRKLQSRDRKGAGVAQSRDRKGAGVAQSRDRKGAGVTGKTQLRRANDLVICGGFMGVALLIVAGVASAGIDGSKHDFSDQAWTAGDKCAACHTPQSEIPPEAPKWNPSADLTRTFGTTTPQRQRRTASDQSGPTEPTNRRQLAGPRTRPGSSTLTCLRCHDGALASDLIPYEERRTTVNTFHPGRTTAGHGSSNHPVGVPYPQFDRKYHPVSAVTARGAVTLPDGYVECMSCHDPHNQADLPHMLVASNSRSALCLTCHRK